MCCLTALVRRSCPGPSPWISKFLYCL
jgi:hypothetical protein